MTNVTATVRQRIRGIITTPCGGAVARVRPGCGGITGRGERRDPSKHQRTDPRGVMGGQGAETMTGDGAGRSPALVVSARHVVAEALASLVTSHTALAARSATTENGLD